MGIEKNYRLDWNYFIKEIKKQFCKPRKSVREVGCIQCENPRTPLFNNIGRGHLRPLVKVLMPSHKTKRSPPFHLRTLALIFYLKGAVEERGGEGGEGKGSRETLIFADCVFLSSGFCILTPRPTSTVFAFPNQVCPTWKTRRLTECFDADVTVPIFECRGTTANSPEMQSLYINNDFQH